MTSRILEQHSHHKIIDSVLSEAATSFMDDS